MDNVVDKKDNWTIDKILISRVVEGDKITKTRTKTKIIITINKVVDKDPNLTATVIEQVSYQEEEDKASTNKINPSALTRPIEEDSRVTNNVLKKDHKIINKYLAILTLVEQLK